MSLLDQVKKAPEQHAQATGTTAATVSGTVAEAPAKAKHSNSEYQKKARAKALASAQVLKACLEKNKIVLSAEEQDALDTLCKVRKVTGSAFGGKATIYKIFGDAPKAGDSVTALKVFESTGKGFSDMRGLMKKWAAQDIVVEFNAQTKSYTIKSGTIPAYVAE